jgi:hypothetical protein
MLLASRASSTAAVAESFIATSRIRTDQYKRRQNNYNYVFHCAASWSAINGRRSNQSYLGGIAGRQAK